MKHNNKLLFPLCGKCVDAEERKFCSHTDEQRVLQGSWTTSEVEEAMSQGYKLIKVIAIQDYKEQSSSMFSGYINKWLKIKQESSDWPSDCVTDEEKDNYIAAYQEKEGIQLEKDKIKKNPGLRQIAKLMLNSFWGKLAQRPNQVQTKVVTESAELFKIIYDEKIEVTGLALVDENSILLSYKYVDDFDSKAGNTSPVIASFVTSYARLELYHLIKRINLNRERILYVDTDSAIYSHIPGVDEEIELGVFLGELTDELDGKICERGVFDGPKCYALRCKRKSDGSIADTIKVKGIRLDGQASEQVTIETMYGLAKEKADNNKAEGSVIMVDQQQFKSTKEGQIVVTSKFQKRFRVTADKLILNGNETYPIGYKEM